VHHRLALPSDQNIEVARKAVETNFVLLWEFDPEGGLRLTHPVDEPLALAEYLKVLGKYRHLSAEQIAHIEGAVARNVKFVKGLAAGVPLAAANPGAGAAA
jgi:phenylglyoxylate dehydrogenase beta subunit